MEKTKWKVVVTRPMTILTQDFFLTVVNEKLRGLLGESHDVGVECKNGSGTVIVGRGSSRKLELAILKNASKDAQFFKKHLKTGRLAMKNLLTTSKKINASSLELSNKQLLKVVRVYEASFHDFAPYLFSVFPIETVLTDQLKKKIRGNEEHFRILTTVQRDSEFYLEQKDLLEIKLLSMNTEVALKKHASTFGYMGLTNDFESEPWNADHFKGFLKDFRNPKKDLKRLIDVRQKELLIYKKFVKNLPNEIVVLAETLQDYMWFRNERIAVLKIAQNNIKPLLLEISNRFQISFNDLIWYKAMELESLLIKGARVNVESRKRYFRIESVNGKLRYIDREMVQAVKAKKITKITGTVASVGRARGIVRVLFSPKEIERVKQGDILVTSMTTPDFVMAMRRSAAIITDEGGVLCHAAIVSREFGIPCITGTRIATQVLKDGDEVIVDAEKGIVHIIEQEPSLNAFRPY